MTITYYIDDHYQKCAWGSIPVDMGCTYVFTGLTYWIGLLDWTNLTTNILCRCAILHSIGLYTFLKVSRSAGQYHNAAYYPTCACAARGKAILLEYGIALSTMS